MDLASQNVNQILRTKYYLTLMYYMMFPPTIIMFYMSIMNFSIFKIVVGLIFFSLIVVLDRINKKIEYLIKIKNINEDG